MEFNAFIICLKNFINKDASFKHYGWISFGKEFIPHKMK